MTMRNASSASSGLSELVERKMRALVDGSKKQTHHEPGHHAPDAGSPIKFYIALSRECGCNADRISELLTERTGFQKFDHEILNYMAEHDEVRRRLFETLDDRAMGWVETVCNSLTFGPSVDGVEYFNRLSHEMLAICHNTHAIIIGRAANFILPREHGLAVRLVAPRDYRLDRYVQRTGLDRQTAAREMARIDRERGDFVEQHFGKFAFDPRRHDITINVSQFTEEHVIDLIVMALKQKAGHSLKLPVKAERQ